MFGGEGPDLRNLPRFKEKKKFSNFPSNWENMSGVYVHPKDKRSFPRPVTVIAPEDYESINKNSNAAESVTPWGFVDSSKGSIEGVSYFEFIVLSFVKLVY